MLHNTGTQCIEVTRSLSTTYRARARYSDGTVLTTLYRFIREPVLNACFFHFSTVLRISGFSVTGICPDLRSGVSSETIASTFSSLVTLVALWTVVMPGILMFALEFLSLGCEASVASDCFVFASSAFTPAFDKSPSAIALDKLLEFPELPALTSRVDLFSESILTDVASVESSGELLHTVIFFASLSFNALTLVPLPLPDPPSAFAIDVFTSI